MSSAAALRSLRNLTARVAGMGLRDQGTGLAQATARSGKEEAESVRTFWQQFRGNQTTHNHPTGAPLATSDADYSNLDPELLAG